MKGIVNFSSETHLCILFIAFSSTLYTAHICWSICCIFVGIYCLSDCWLLKPTPLFASYVQAYSIYNISGYLTEHTANTILEAGKGLKQSYARAVSANVTATVDIVSRVSTNLKSSTQPNSSFMIYIGTKEYVFECVCMRVHLCMYVHVCACMRACIVITFFAVSSKAFFTAFPSHLLIFKGSKVI